MEKLLEKIKAHPLYRGQIVHIENLPSRPPRYGELSLPLHPVAGGSLRRLGIEKLYTHQADAIDKIRQGKNVVVVTPTASGKSMCYNLPVLDSFLRQPGSTALYLFPTKSLGRDQLDKITDFGAGVKSGVYDGDTPDGEKAALRSVRGQPLTLDILSNGRVDMDLYTLGAGLFSRFSPRFLWECHNISPMAYWPHTPHRTGRAQLRHPALHTTIHTI